jgi:uncharacterized protein (DUF433 family)
MPTLDRSQCPAVENVPDRLSGAWVFRNTRMPVSAVFENFEAGATVDEIVEQFDISREQINEVLEFCRPQPRRSSDGRLRPRYSFSLTTLRRKASQKSRLDVVHSLHL